MIKMTALARASVLLAASGLFSNAQAAIDYGQTIDSVSVTSSTEYVPYRPSDGYPGYTRITETPLIAKRAEVIDQQTGLQWIKASSLEEGQAIGYRAATADEFRSLLSSNNWTVNPEAANQWTQSSGLDYRTRSTYSTLGSSSATYTTVSNMPSISFEYDAFGSTWIPEQSTVYKVSLGLLDDGVGGVLTGALYTQNRTSSSFQPSASGTSTSSSSTSYTNTAALAPFADLPTGAFASGMSQVNPSALSYYMVASVPEPSTWGLMLLGLAGAVVATRQRKQSA